MKKNELLKLKNKADDSSLSHLTLEELIPLQCGLSFTRKRYMTGQASEKLARQLGIEDEGEFNNLIEAIGDLIQQKQQEPSPSPI